MSSPPESLDCQPTRLGVWPTVAEVGLILALFFVHAGYPVPDVNEPHYLCKAHHFWDPASGAGDFFIESADAHTLFYWGVGWLTGIMPLAWAAWLGRLVTWTLLAWAWQRLSWRVLPYPLISVLTAALFVTLNYRAELAGEWIVGGVEAKGFAYVLVLCGLERALADRWNGAWLCLGGAAAWHVLVGGWVVVALAIVWLALGNRDRPSFRTMLPGLLGGAALSLVGLIPALALTWDQPADLTRQANQIYVFERLRHHLALLHLPPAETIERLGRHAALLAGLSCLWWLVQRSIAKPTRIRRLVLFAAVAAGIASLGLAIEWITWSAPDTAARWLRYYWFRLTDFAAPLTVAFLIGGLVADRLRKSIATRVAWLVVACGAIGWHLGDVMLDRYQNPLPRCESPLAKQTDAKRAWDAYLDWIDICQVAATRTPAQSRFLTPVQAQSFKWRTGRSEVVTRKDIPQDARGIVEWSYRIDRIHRWTNLAGERMTYRSLAAAGTPHIAQLAREFPFDFVLTRSVPRLQFPILYRNARYVIYRLPRYLGKRPVSSVPRSEK